MEPHEERLARNSISGIIRVIVLIPVLLWITPFTVQKLGVELYGLWSLGAVVTSFAALGDLGLGIALIKYIAEFLKDAEFEEINKLVNTTLISFIVIALILTTLIVAISPFLIRTVFKIPMALHSKAYTLFWGICLVFSLNMVLGTFTNIIDGCQRMELSNLLRILSTIVQALMTLITLNMGLGIKGLVLGNAIAALLSGIVSFIFAKKLIPSLELSLRFINLETFKKTLRYSLQVQLANFIAMGFDPFIRGIISNLASLSSVSIYDLGSRIISQFRSLATVALNPLMPASAELSKNDETQSLVDLHRKAENAVYIFGSIIYIIPIGLISGFVALWLGPDFASVSTSIQILMIGWYASLVSTPAFILFRGYGKPVFTICTQLILVSINIVLGIILGRIYGYYGILVSIVIALIISSLYTMIKFGQFTKSRWEGFSIKTGFLCLFLAAVISAGTGYLYNNLLSPGYFTLIFVSFVGIIAYFVLIFALGLLSKDDLVNVKTVLKKRKFPI